VVHVDVDYRVRFIISLSKQTIYHEFFHAGMEDISMSGNLINPRAIGNFLSACAAAHEDARMLCSVTRLRPFERMKDGIQLIGCAISRGGCGCVGNACGEDKRQSMLRGAAFAGEPQF
jgi:hypothetical protein